MSDNMQPRKSVLFPGQGSQEQGMGRDLAEHDEQVMELWRTAEKMAGTRLREIFWDGDRDAMTQTRYQQPALFVVGLGLWKHLGPVIRPDFVAGHSVGEYTALAAAGVLEPREALEVVSLRGRLMYEAGEQRAGSMAAVLKLPQERVEALVQEVRQDTAEDLCVANFNSQEQIVISGATAAVEAAAEKVREYKGRCKTLPVSGAFHSPLMDEAARELAGVMRKLSWNAGKIPVHLNVTAKATREPGEILDIMQRQMISPVHWSHIILDQWERGVRFWWELGPKGVLTRLMRHVLTDKEPGWEAECVAGAEQAAAVRDRLR